MESIDIEKMTSDFIENEVKKNWDKNGKAILLSTIGTLIRKNVPDSGTVIKGGIKDYLRQRPIVQQIQYPGIAEKIGLIPLGVALPNDLTVLFQKSPINPTERITPVYQTNFWRAFFQSLASRRFVVVESDGGIKIIEDNEPEQSVVSYEILDSDIVSTPVGSELSDKVQATHEKINAWLARNSLSKEIFIKSSHDLVSIKPEDKIHMLRQVFGGLPIEDQARISIPMDILLKMISRH